MNVLQLTDVEFIRDQAQLIGTDIAHDIDEDGLAFFVQHRDDQAVNGVVAALLDVDIDIIAVVIVTNRDQLRTSLSSIVPQPP